MGLLPVKASTKELVAPVEQKAVIIDPRFFWGPGFSLSGSGLVINADRDEYQATMAYGLASLAHICMEYRAKKFSEAPLGVVEIDDDEEEFMPEHELAGFLARPAPDMAMRELLRLTSLFRDATGACVWVKVRTRGGEAAMLRPFPKDDVTVEPLGDRNRGRFRVHGVRGPELDLSWRDVVYFVNPDPTPGQWVDGAVAPLDAALNLVNLDESIRVQARNMIKKAVRPTGAFSTDQNLTDDQFDRAREQINQRVQGPQNAGDWLLLEGGAKWQQIQQTMSETFPEALMAWIEARVCAVFGLHPSVLGIKVGMENSPWSNLEQATTNVYHETIIPRWQEDAEVLTDQLLREFDQDLEHEIRFDTSKIKALQEKFEDKAKAFAPWSWAMKTDEARVNVLGLEPLGGKEGEQRFIDARLQPLEMLTMEALSGARDMERNRGNGRPGDDDERDPVDDRMRGARA